jgi:hypothetical protein
LVRFSIFVVSVNWSDAMKERGLRSS